MVNNFEDQEVRNAIFEACFNAVSDFKMLTMVDGSTFYCFKYDGEQISGSETSGGEIIPCNYNELTASELLDETLLNQRLIAVSTKLFPHPVTAGERRMYEMFWADQIAIARQKTKDKEYKAN